MKIDNITNKLSIITKQESGSDDAKLKKACRDFESMLIHQMLKEMRKSVPETDFFGSDKSEQIFTEMIDQEMANSIADTGSMQIAKILYSQFSESAKRVKVPGKHVD